MVVCKKHPKYKAIKFPTSQCSYCWEIWKFANALTRENFNRNKVQK